MHSLSVPTTEKQGALGVRQYVDNPEHRSQTTETNEVNDRAHV